MSSKYLADKQITSVDINESRINHHLSLRKKEYYKMINNKRKIFSDINSLFQNISDLPNSSDKLLNNNIFKILSNQQILEIIDNLKKQELSIKNNLTEISQCLFSLDFNINQNLLNSIKFIEDNKIYIFLIDFLDKMFNSSCEQYLNIHSIEQLINKTLQILVKYSSDKENNSKMVNYINNDNKINIFNQIISSLAYNNKTNNNNSQHNIIINNNKETDILIYLNIILYNLSIISNDLFKKLQKNKIEEKLISIINDKKNNLKIDDNNIIYFTAFFSLNLLSENITNKEETYILNIFQFLNQKGITSLNQKAQELSLCCLCNITSSYESDTFYKKIIYSGIFDNIFQVIKVSKSIYPILVSLKIVNNILTEKNIDLNYFINSNLLKGLINLMNNYQKNKQNLTPDLLHHIISIFLYLTKSPLFYSLINSDNELTLIKILINIIGIISNKVTHDILTFIKDIMEESYKISQLIIYYNKELIIKLINIIKEDCHNYKITTMSAIILAKILRYLHENNNKEKKCNTIDFKEYECQIKEIVEVKILNENEINENLKKTFQILLNIIEDK